MFFLRRSLILTFAALHLTVLLPVLGGSALAEPQASEILSARAGFVSGNAESAIVSQLKWKVKRPRIPRGQVLDALQIRGCWTKEGLKSIKVKGKGGKRIKAKTSTTVGRIELKKVKPEDFPLTVVATFTSPREVLSGGSAFVGLSSPKCTRAPKKERCEKGAPIETRQAVDGVACSSPADFEEAASTGQIVLADGGESDFFPLTARLRFAAVGAAFGVDLTDATVTVDDDSYFGADLMLESGLLAMVSSGLADGLHTVSVHANDTSGNQLEGNFRVWAGGSTLTVLLKDKDGAAVDSGSVTLVLGDDKSLTLTKPLTAGSAIFQNIPARTIALTAITPDGRTGFLATTGSAGTVSITVNGFNPASTVANNDISQGAAGWDFAAGTPVTVENHVETAGISARIAAQEVPDQDLVLATGGEGPQFMSRTFNISAGTRSIVVRYRFVTSEFPGGYFGSRYNDYFNLAIRTLKGGGSVSDGNSMNALGQGAFSPAGSTSWRTVTLPVGVGGDTVQIDVAVANVADGAYGSNVTIDYVKESKFAITQSALFDIDGSDLKYISGDDHPYFNKFTHIWGTIKVEGDKDDGLKDLELQILEGTTLRATAKLSTQANKKIIKKFGKQGFVLIKDPMLLFKIFPNDAAQLDSLEDNKTFALRVRATSTKGETAEADGGEVGLLVRFKGTSRYDGRDELEGGDDWTKPTVRKFANDLSGVVFGDFSNMNGGSFTQHSEHRDGTDVDGWVDGYNQRNANTARSLIELLNTTPGRRIQRILVRFTRSDTNSFWNYIRDKTLDDHRPASRVFIPDSMHATHFHMDVRE